MDIQSGLTRGRFFLKWVSLTAVGYAVGFLLAFILGHFVLGNVMIGVGIGTGVGLVQWLLLRRFVQRSGWLMLANVGGLTLSLALYALVNALWRYPFDLGWPFGALGWAVALGAGGAMAGLLQLRILRPQLGLSNWWIAASAVGWGSSALGLAIPADMSGHYPGILVALLFVRNGMLAPAVAGVILGAVTGAALIWMLRQRHAGGESSTAAKAT